MYYMYRLLHFQDNNTKEVKKCLEITLPGWESYITIAYIFHFHLNSKTELHILCPFTI